MIKNIFDIKKKFDLKFKFIHFSTDHVYNSNRNFYFNKEKDVKKNINYYALTKRKAEQICLQNKESLILRTNFIGKSFSKKLSFSDWLFDKIIKNEKILLAKDSYFSPLRPQTIAKLIELIIKNNKFKAGLFNFGSNGGISKYRLGMIFINKFNKNFKTYEIKKINEITKVKRPKNMQMDSKKFTKVFKLKLPSTLGEINKILKDYEN